MAENNSSTRLILVDSHALIPFIVRSHQFSCRALSFAQHWPGLVELWLPGPQVPKDELARRTGMAPPVRFACRFGPRPEFSVLGIRVRSKARFRSWLKATLRQLTAENARCLFYFRTLKLADQLRPPLREHGWRYAFEPHEVFFESAKNPAELCSVETAVYREAACLFPITNALKEGIQTKLGITTPMQVSPLGHTGANFNLPAYDPQAPPRFLYVGSLHKWKGLIVAFDATAGLGIPFDVVGDAGGLAFHQEHCRRENYSHVLFHGQAPPDQLTPFYAPGSICLLPLSHAEIARAYTSPLKIFEYLAAGRPVLAGDVPAMREIVQDEVQARLVRVGDVAAWREALRELIANRQNAARLAAAGRELAKSSLWTKRAEPIIRRLDELTRSLIQ